MPERAVFRRLVSIYRRRTVNRVYLSVDLNTLSAYNPAMHPFAALADPTRREIVALLGPGPLPAGEIASRFRTSAPAISQHLKVLRDAKLVTVRTNAQRRIYDLDPRGFRELDEWRSQIRHSWRSRADVADRPAPSPTD